MQETISIVVAGKVQGVFYRQETKRKARMLEITGEVKNKRDGTVYIIATGSKDKLEELIAWCKTGPSRAVVTDVIVNKIDVQHFDKFEIVH
jgi:acylphosphatase